MKLRQIFENIYEDGPEEFDGSLKTIGVCFGRFNPPHKGHKAVWKAASANPIWYVGTNQSTSGPKDPLPYDVKLQAMAAVWPKVAGHVIPEQSLLTLASRIYEEHGGNVNLKVYTDEDWLVKTLMQYNGVEKEHGMYKFNQIDHVRTQRLASATNLRAAVRAGDRDAFYRDMGIKPSVTLDINGKEYPVFDVVAHYLNKYPEKVKKTAAVAEEFGVGKITKQNTTCDVDASTPAKNLKAFKLAESHMAELHAEIGEYLDGPLSGFKQHRVDADAFGGYCVKLAHLLARKHDVDQNVMQHLVNDYVDSALEDEDPLSEGKHRKSLRKSIKQSMSNLSRYDTLDNNNQPYLAYRFGVALAGSPDGDMDKRGPLGSAFTMADYTEADTEIRRGAEKVMGVKQSSSTGKGSKELDIVNTTSPVAKPKKNKYGV